MMDILYMNLFSLGQIITYYLLLITYYLLLITYILPSFPSPDRNGYPTAWVGEWVGLSVGVHGREEYEWIAGNSS
ncbi:hypothetical protein A1704_09740 [Chryseobacterium cucumeris]|nr:hypothetical protein A1704_09740 [Chryseobacterium cucumeris]